MTTAKRAERGRYPIRAVSKLTGIGIDTLRAWERRYSAVAPARDDRGRVYTDADILRLKLLQKAVAAGHSVGRIATLSDDELRGLTEAPSFASTPRSAENREVDTSHLRAALLALDNGTVDRELSRLATMLSPEALVRDVVLPVARDIGDRWEERPGGIAHEHLLSATLQHLLGSFLRVYAGRGLPTRLLFATPSGERHELGILGAAMLAASRGFAISYLGPDLPVEEIVTAVQLANAQVLVLGVTLTTGETHRTKEVRTLVRRLSAGVELWVGGPGANQHTTTLGARGIALLDFGAYVEQLDRLSTRREVAR